MPKQTIRVGGCCRFAVHEHQGQFYVTYEPGRHCTACISRLESLARLALALERAAERPKPCHAQARARAA
jgi:hypothetical protein